MRFLPNNLLNKSAAYTALLFFGVFCFVLTLDKEIIQVKVKDQTCKITSNDFDLQWKHSVEKTSWLEHYTKQNSNFILNYTDIVSFGAGTPSNYPVIWQKNGIVRLQVNKNFKELHWTISQNMKGSIIHSGKTWKIYQDFDDYSLVNISIQKIPYFKVIFIGECA